MANFNKGMKGKWTVSTGDLQYVVLYHKEYISNKNKPIGGHCDAEGAARKIQMLTCGKDVGVLKRQGPSAFTAVCNPRISDFIKHLLESYLSR